MKGLEVALVGREKVPVVPVGGGTVDNKVGEKKDIDTIERIQRKTTKIILELRDVSYEERIKECGLTTPEKKRLRGN